jgi:hypothetical protein
MSEGAVTTPAIWVDPTYPQAGKWKFTIIQTDRCEGYPWEIGWIDPSGEFTSVEVANIGELFSLMRELLDESDAEGLRYMGTEEARTAEGEVNGSVMWFTAKRNPEEPQG